MKFVHLDSSSVVCLGYHYLIICIRFGRFGTETEVRRLCINRMQTILADVLLRIDENPSLRVLSCVTIAFKVSTIDVPSTPVTARIRTCIVTSRQCVEEWVGLVLSTENDVGITIFICLTSPLGSLNLNFFLLTCFRIYLLLCIIQSNTIDEVTIEAVAPFANGVTT